MKIERTNKAFQPIELKITIETEEERFNLKQLTNYPLTIDDKIKECGCGTKQQIIMGFLVELGKQLDVD